MDSSSSTTFKDQILSKKCELHSVMPCDMLNLDPKTERHQICMLCILEQNISIDEVTNICSLLNFDPSTKIPIFPLKRDYIYLKLIECDFSLEKIQNEIDQFYSELCEKVQKSLYKLRDQESLNIQNLISQRNQAKLELENLLSIKQLQELILRQDDKVLHEYIERAIPQSQQKIKQIFKSYSSFDKVQCLFSTEKPRQIQEQIISLINSINLFVNDKSSLKFPSIQQKYFEKVRIKLQPSQFYEKSLSDMEIKNSIILATEEQSWKQCYLADQLNPKQKYIIRLSIHNMKDELPYFAFGLINKNNKDIKRVDDSDGIFYRENTGGNTKSIVKGNQLHSRNQTKKIGNKNLEFRFHIAEKYWRVSSHPEYLNVSQLDDPNLIQPSTPYYFGFYFCNNVDSITIEEILEVDEFDNKM